MTSSYTLRVLRGMHQVSATAWDALLDPLDPPVLRWHWLEAMERCGTASADKGWRPHHVTVRSGSGQLVAACPLWLRDDPSGEFVWYEPVQSFCATAGFAWGPRGVSTVPATPVAGRRFLTGALARPQGVLLLAAALEQLLEQTPLASVNLHFCAADEAEALCARGWIERRQWQYWWRSAGELDFDGFLDRLVGKMRRQIRRERKLLRAAGIELRMVPGPEAPDSWFAQADSLYGLTATRADEGERLIGPGFFQSIGASPLREQVRLSVGLEDGELVGLAFEIEGADALFGRTWGLSRPVPYLHFECAYYQSVEYAISRGLTRFEPGHGGEFKHRRGFEPTVVRTLHRYRDPALHGAVAAWARREGAAVDAMVAERRATGTLRVFSE